ncbi:MAG: phosphodiester glycosidase family protein, partial [Alphaproteobacteria bacterium]|nr:phosphodiester glycosidase family protein [Alphaproteobacteria bacterium]
KNIITSGYHPDRVIAFYEDGTLAMSQVQLEYSYLSLQENSTNQEIIGYFNVPDGGAGGLFLYNRNYASSTLTAGERIEVVIQVEDMQMGVNRSITGSVKEILSGGNTPIGNQELILSTSKSSPYYTSLSQLVVGEQVEISCREKGTGLADAVEAVGLYYSIVENGRMVTNGTAVNPRTALGVKRDGSLVLYVVDGRQGSLSNGLTIEELAEHMIELGCISAWNLDGGGSSQMLVRKPGMDETALLKNSPSGGAARTVSNGLLLVYEEAGTHRVSHIHTYPSNTILLPGESVVMKTYATNSLYEKMTVPNGVQYEVDRYGTMEENQFTAGASVGDAIIKASVEGMKAEATVQIVNQVRIIPASEKWTIKPGESRKVE